MTDPMKKGTIPLTQTEGLSSLQWDRDGLIPAIVQDHISKDVLMMAYMNKESLEKTLETGQTWFWSRSRQSLWHKGSTSGNVQHISAIRYDCDADTLLLLVEPEGPACHTGHASCFHHEVEIEQKRTTQPSSIGTESGVLTGRFEILSKLESVIAARELERPEGAYTTYLFNQGLDKILKKVGEEAAEVIIAAKNQSAEELRYEASDLIFHLLVLLREQKLPLDALMQELDRRHMK